MQFLQLPESVFAICLLVKSLEKSNRMTRVNRHKFLYLLVAITAVSSLTLSFRIDERVQHDGVDGDKKDSIVSKKAFLNAYRVLMHPRCMNCHPVGDAPLQGEDSHVHDMSVKRGPDGKGLYALKCSNCHQSTNTPGLHMPPGNPNWHLPPENMKMVFEGKSARELAIQLIDMTKNGGKTKEQLVEHVTSDKLVLSGWSPGEGRALPPLAHKEFAQQFKLWIESGAYAPD